MPARSLTDFAQATWKTIICSQTFICSLLIALHSRDYEVLKRKLQQLESLAHFFQQYSKFWFVSKTPPMQPEGELPSLHIRPCGPELIRSQPLVSESLPLLKYGREARRFLLLQGALSMWLTGEHVPTSAKMGMTGIKTVARTSGRVSIGPCWPATGGRRPAFSETCRLISLVLQPS
jgi:hypothetical protein